MTPRILIVPAAGTGSRLGASVPKPLVPVAGTPMLERIVELYASLVRGVVVIVSPAAGEAMRAWRRGRDDISLVPQTSPTGMLDAILLARDEVTRARPDEIWISWADQIGVLPATVRRLAAAMATSRPSLALPTVLRPEPYTHFERDAAGRIVGLRQRREGDGMPKIGESDMGVFALDAATYGGDLFEYAHDREVGAATGERNFLPFIPWLAARKPVVTVASSDPMEALGVNTPEELHVMEQWLERR